MPVNFFQSTSEPETTNNFDLKPLETQKFQDLSLEQRDDKQNERKRRHQQLKVILQQQMEEFNQLEEQVCVTYICILLQTDLYLGGNFQTRRRTLV